MPNPPTSKIDLTGESPDLFAQWLTQRFGGNLQSNRVAAAEVWKRAGDTSALQDYFGTGEVLDDLFDYLQERRGMKSDNPNPRKPDKNGKYGKPLWLTPPSKKQATALGLPDDKLIPPFGMSP